MNPANNITKFLQDNDKFLRYFSDKILHNKSGMILPRRQESQLSISVTKNETKLLWVLES